MAAQDSTPSRVCTSCKVEYPATLDHFPPHKIGKFGLHSWCRACKKRIDAERRSRPDQLARQQAWRDANKDRVKGYNEAYREAGYKSTGHVAAWRAKNIEKCREYARNKARLLYAANPEKYRRLAREHYYRNHQKVLACSRAYSEKNRDQINARAAERKKAAYRSDPGFNLKHKIAARLRRLVYDKAGASTESILGYARDELVAHIEKQFTKGMSWEKVLSGEIHIDHIVPVSAFNYTSVDDPECKACWALTNLRPLWAKDNLAKGAKVLTLL